MALLRLLCALGPSLDMKLIVAHFDHQLRPDSAQDMHFVEKTASRLHFTFVSEKEDVKAFALKKRLSLEEAARTLRYAFLEETALQYGAAKVAVAHTWDDQAETILMRILRGTGMEGLRGMSEVRPLGQVQLIRPLLKVRRADLRHYLQSKKMIYREDSSNQDLSFTRNRVRKILIPLLKKEFNPRIEEELIRLAALLESDQMYLEKGIGEIFRKHVNKGHHSLHVSLDLLKSLDLAIQRRLIRKMFSHLTDSETLSYVHVEKILSFLKDSQSGKKILLPKKAEAYIEFDCFGMRASSCASGSWSRKWPVCSQKMLKIGKVEIEINIQESSRKEFSKDSRPKLSFRKTWDEAALGKRMVCCEYFNADQIKGLIEVRSRKSGDAYDPIGLGSFKKVKEIFVNEKIPLALRNDVPVFVSAGKIFWIAGYRISESFKIRPQTKKVIKIGLNFNP